jgi:hypothetical protein
MFIYLFIWSRLLANPSRRGQEYPGYRFKCPRAWLSSDNVLTQLGGALQIRARLGPSQPMVGAGCKRDCRVRLHASHTRGLSDGGEGTRINVYSLIYNVP